MISEQEEGHSFAGVMILKGLVKNGQESLGMENLRSALHFLQTLENGRRPKMDVSSKNIMFLRIKVVKIHCYEIHSGESGLCIVTVRSDIHYLPTNDHGRLSHSTHSLPVTTYSLTCVNVIVIKIQIRQYLQNEIRRFSKLGCVGLIFIFCVLSVFYKKL